MLYGQGGIGVQPPCLGRLSAVSRAALFVSLCYGLVGNKAEYNMDRNCLSEVMADIVSQWSVLYSPNLVEFKSQGQ